jgi:hypothetical protein
VSSHQLTVTDAVGSAQSSAFNITVESTATYTPTNLEVSSGTYHSIGIKFDIGDTTTGPDPDTSYVSVQYKKSTDSVWSDAHDLLRNDYRWFYGSANPPPGSQAKVSNFAGSIMFLTPGTTYNVRLNVTLDGVNQGQVVFEATTKALPVKPVDLGTNVIYVDNSVAGPGSGTTSDPYDTIKQAITAATPGDYIRIRTGNATYIHGNDADMVDCAGSAGNWIVIEPDGTDTPVIDQLPLRSGAGYVWFDGLTFQSQLNTADALTRSSTLDWEEDGAIYVGVGQQRVDNITITGCTFTGYQYSIYSPYVMDGWTCMDNTIVGMFGPDEWYKGRVASGGGVGIGLGGEGNPGGTGNVIAYNTISETGDSIAVGGIDNGRNADVYGNNTNNTVGNSCSTDNGYENLRIFGNIFTQCGTAPISLQPQRQGPWYFCYNQIGGTRLGLFKWKVQDRLVLVNNTFHIGGSQEEEYLLHCISRNNIWVSSFGACWITKNNAETTTARLSTFDPYWATDLDYDGFDWTGANAFSWHPDAGSARTNYTTIASFVSALGVETNAIEITKETDFTNWTLTGPFRNDINTADSYGINNDPLLLATGSSAIGAGIKVDNLADFYTEDSPGRQDLGCHNKADGAPQYGARTSELSTPLDQRTYDWSKH